MANVSGQGTTFNLPSYLGMLWTSSKQNTQFMNAIGGLANAKRTTNQDFATSSEYTLEDAAQPGITETASLTAPTAVETVRSQVLNTTEIHQKAIKISYAKLANRGRLEGLNTAGGMNPVDSERAFQERTRMQEIARDINFSFLRGAYQKGTDAATAAKNRGVVTLANANTTVAAGGSDIDSTILNSLIVAMDTAGAPWINPVIFCDATQAQKIDAAFSYAPEDRNVGGTNINRIVSPIIGQVPVIIDRAMPSATILLADVNVCAPVIQEVPGHPLFEPELLARTGAGESWQMFGMVGLDHGPAFAHGSITGLGT